jgi:hypothetical protein
MSRLRPLLIVIVGLALGAGLGLYLGWVAWPTEFTDANPAVLQDVYRQDYARLIAAAYTADDNLPAAQKQVASLGDDGRDVVLAVTLDTILQGGDEAEIRQLVRLAAALGLESPAMVPYLPERAP